MNSGAREPVKVTKLPPLKLNKSKIEPTAEAKTEKMNYAKNFEDNVTKANLRDAHAMTAAVQLCMKLIEDAAQHNVCAKLPIRDMVSFLVDLVNRDKRSNVLRLALDALRSLAVNAASIVDSPMWDYALKGACSHLGSSDRFLKESALATVAAICTHARPRSSLLVLLGVLAIKMKSEAVVSCLLLVGDLVQKADMTRNITEKLNFVLFKLSNDPHAEVRRVAKNVPSY